MAKSDLGTKRICPTTGKKFYDLNKSPVISPYTGEVVPIAPVAPPRMTRGAAAAAPSMAAEMPEPAENENLVSLEEADAEALCEAMSRPTMRFVPVKTTEQQAALMMVGLRDRLNAAAG